MDKKHDNIPMKVGHNDSTTKWGSQNEGSKAKARCSSPLPVDRNMKSSGGGDGKGG